MFTSFCFRWTKRSTAVFAPWQKFSLGMENATSKERQGRRVVDAAYGPVYCSCAANSSG